MSDSLNGDDPAADFLAREQATLAGLEDDLNLNEAHTNGIVDEFANGHIEDGSVRRDETGTGSPPSVAAENKPEPEKIRVWREEQEKMLRQKDQEEAVKKEELKQQAKKELAEWEARYAEQLEKSRKANRIAEKEWMAERDSKEEPASPDWQKIAKMCEFNPKTGRSDCKDTSRLKSILLKLKGKE